jgi:autotransporter-associated beta strand protein
VPERRACYVAKGVKNQHQLGVIGAKHNPQVLMTKHHPPVRFLRQNAVSKRRRSLAGLVQPFALAVCVLFAGAVYQPVAQAGTLTWDPNGATAPNPSDGPGNWDTSSLFWFDGTNNVAWDNATPASAVFGAGTGAAGAVTVGSGINVANLTFNPPGSGNYNLSGNPLTLSGNPTITVNASLGVINSVLAGAAFTKAGAGQLTLIPSNPNTFTGTTIINSGAVTCGGSDNRTYINGDLIVNPAGAFWFTNANPVAASATVVANGGIVGYGSTSSKTFSVNKFVLANGGALVQAGGTLTFAATNLDARSGSIGSLKNSLGPIYVSKSTPGTVTIVSRANTGATDGYVMTNVAAGSLAFDYTAQSSQKILPGQPMTLGGGALVLTNGGANTRTEAVSATTVNPGASAVQLNNNTSGAGKINLTVNALTRNTGGTADFSKLNSTAAITTTSGNVNGILGGWATYGGADWAVGTALAAYAAYDTGTDSTTWAATDNVSLNANPIAPLNTLPINSLRLTNGPTVTLNAGQTLTLSSGGLLVVGASPTTITGGSLQGASGGDLIVLQNSSGDVTIGSDLADNNTCSLTKSGSGKLILTGANHLSGTNYLNGGTVELSDLAKLASGPLVMNGGALRYTGADATSSRNVTVNGLGATFDIAGSATVTQSGTINGSGAPIGDLGGLTKIGSGTLVLTASNYYSGSTVVSNGTLLVNGTNAINSGIYGAGNVAVYGGTLGGTGKIAGTVAVKNGATLSPGGTPGTLTVSGPLSLETGSTCLFDVTNTPGTGDLLIVQGNLTVSNGSIAINILGTQLAPGTYTLIQYSGTKSGSFNPTVVVTSGTINGSPVIDESTLGQINLVIKHEVAISSQPQDAVVSVGDTANFTVTATGTTPLAYQWYYYGGSPNNSPTPRADATNASLAILNAQPSDSGYYAVVVTNGYSSITSRIASLFVGNVAPI